MIGGDLNLKEITFGITSKDETKLFKDECSSKRISMVSAVVLLLNAAMATDPFYFGSYFNCGVIQSFLIGIFVMMIVTLSFKVYLQTWVYGSSSTYRELWIKCFGRSSVFIPSVLILIAYSSITMICTKEHFSEFLGIVTEFFPHSYFVDSKWAWVFFVVIVTFFPFLYLEKGSGFYLTAYIAKFGLLVGMSAVVYTFVDKVQKEGFDPKKQTILWSSNSDYFFDSFAGFNVVMFLNPVIHYIMRDLIDPTKIRIMKCIWITESVTLVSCLITGYASYFMYFENNGGDNVLSYFNPNKTVTIVGKIGSILSNTGLNAFYIWVLSQEISNVLLSGCEKSILIRIFTGLVVILFNVAMDCLSQTTKDVFFLLGNFSFIFLSFVFPSMFFLKIYGFINFKWALYSVLVIVISVPISFSSLKYQISALE